MSSRRIREDEPALLPEQFQVLKTQKRSTEMLWRDAKASVVVECDARVRNQVF